MAEKTYQEHRAQRLSDLSPEPENVDAPQADRQDSPPVEGDIDRVDSDASESHDERRTSRNRRTEERFNRLTSRLREKDTEIAELKGRVDTLMTYANSAPDPKPEDARLPEERPQRDQYDDDDVYVEALAEWRATKIVNDALTKEREEVSAAQAKSAEEQRLEALQQQYAENLGRAKSRYSDYDEVVQTSDLRVDGPVVEAIWESDLGPELVYYLASNPGEVDRLNRLGAVALGRALGKIEESLTPSSESSPGDRDDVEPPPRAPPQRPPRPVAPVSGRGPTDSVARIEKANYRDYRARRLADKRR